MAMPPRRPPPVDVDVVRVEPLPGAFVRVTLGGPALAEFAWPGAASHLKLFPPSRDEPSTTDGVAPRRTSRTYTPRRLDPTHATLELELLLHGEGPASAWAAGATVGDRVQVSRPRASYRIEPDTPALWLAGDDSAVPAIATILEAFPEVPSRVVIETVSAETDRPLLPTRSNLATEWVRADASEPGRALEAAIRNAPPPVEGTAVWVACEAVAVRRLRAYFADELAVPHDRLVTRGYWRLGAANHPDHDFGEEPISA